MAMIEKITSSTSVTPSAMPFRFDGTNRDAAVLLLHGFTGQTSDMRFLAARLHGLGYTVSVPRYPGHGTNRSDFQTTGWRDWLREAMDAYFDLAGRYGNIMVGGLSMGGVITAILAARFPVSRIALFAPAFETTNRLVSLTPALQYLVPPFRTSEPETHDDPEQQYLADEYWNWNFPRQVASLHRLIRLGRRSLRQITVPTLTIISEADRTVPLTVGDRLERSLATEERRIVRLKRSGHVITTGEERETVAELTEEWFHGESVTKAL